MISVGIAAITADFTVNVSAAFLSVFQFFQEDDAGAFAHDETIAVFIEGARCMSRVIVARAQSFHSGKASYGTGRYSGFGTTGNSGVEFAALDHAVSSADGVRACGTSRDNAGTMALEAEEDGYLARCHVGNHLRYDEGVDAGRTFREQAFVQVVERFHTANARTDDGADAVAVFFIQIDFGIVKSQFGSSYGELRGRVHMADFFTVDAVVSGVKIFDFAGNAGSIFGCVKVGNGANAVFAVEQGIPESIFTDANRRNDT